MPRPPTRRRAAGDAAEEAARRALEAQGLRLLARNVGYRFGELDLVMRDGAALVFVEVRFRSGGRFGDGASSITAAKCRRIALAAQAWLARNPALAALPCRFDVVSVSGEGEALKTDWLRAAFTLDDL